MTPAAPHTRRTNRATRLVLSLAGVLGTLASAASAQPMPASTVTPRPGVAIPDGTVTSITPQEIVVRPIDPAEPLHRYGWHEVQAIKGLSDDRREALEIGRRIWHSDLRLDRGDWTSAESLLEPIEPALHGSAGPTAVAYYRALLRVRLARMDRPAAARAWLSLVAAGDSDTPADPELGPFYFRPDPPAPITETSALARVHGLALSWASGSASDADALRDEVDSLLESVSSSDADGRLPALCLAAYAGSASVRDSARDELASLARLDSTHRGLWARYALARARTLEAEPNRVRLGIAGLLEVSLRDERTAPLLAGLALAEAANAAGRIGDPRAARVLATEFRRRFPAHPADHTIPDSLSPLPDTPETTP